jgi:hypothetical protein
MPGDRGRHVLPGVRAAATSRGLVLESRIMNQTRRTTVAAKRSSLDTLEAEAHRRGVALTVVLAEAVDEKAASLHRVRRPRLGIGRSTDGLSAAQVTAAPVAEPPS